LTVLALLVRLDYSDQMSKADPTVSDNGDSQWALFCNEVSGGLRACRSSDLSAGACS
jgi:hypothetical protein